MDIVVTVLSFCGTLLGGYLYSYFRKKGEHLATKEDIEEITRKIETVKTELGQRLRINSFRYEKEFAVLVDINKAIFEFRELATQYGRMIETAWSRGNSTAPKSEFHDLYIKKSEELRYMAEAYRPFYPEDVYDMIIDFDRECSACANHALKTSTPPEFNEHWDLARISAKTIVEKADQIVHAIRKRIKLWEQT